MDIAQVLLLFVARLVAGYALILAAAGRMVTHGSWPAVSLFVIAGLSLVAIPAGAWWLPAGATAAAALLVERARAFSVKGLRETFLPAVPALWLLASVDGFPPHVSALLGGLAAAGALGSMLLGHSYLTARGLAFTPLSFLSRLLLAVLAVRAALVVPVFFRDDLQMGDWIFLAARAGFGLLIPLVLAWMVVQCVKIRSNQSATGILYAMTVLVFAGELTAAFLWAGRGIPA